MEEDAAWLEVVRSVTVSRLSDSWADGIQQTIIPYASDAEDFEETPSCEDPAEPRESPTDESLLGVSHVEEVPHVEDEPSAPPAPLQYNVHDLGGDGSGGLEDFSNMLRIQRLSSTDILYEERRKPPKMVGKYLFGDVLGEGSYGKVKECLDSTTLTRRAVKIMKKHKLRRIPGGIQNVATEIRLLKKLDHPNVIRLAETFERAEKGKLYVVMEYCVGSLLEMLDGSKEKRLPIWQSHGYFLQLIDGIEYLHSKGIAHKDIKPSNLLLTVDERVKIIDFGVAEEFELYKGSCTTRLGQGTPKFQAPEIASGRSGSYAAFPLDWWSAGVSLFFLVSGEYPFDGSTILKLYESIVRCELKVPEYIQADSLLNDFLAALLTKDPSKRLNLCGVREHGWVRRKPPYSRVDRVGLPAGAGDASRNSTVYHHLVAMYDDDDLTPPRSNSPFDEEFAEFEADEPTSDSVHRGQGAALAARLAAELDHGGLTADEDGSGLALSFQASGTSNGGSTSAPMADAKSRKPRKAKRAKEGKCRVQ